MDRLQGSPRPGSTKLRSDPSKPESPYLHDRLQARRSQAKRSRRSDLGPRLRALDDDIFFAEAETASQPNTSPLATRGGVPEPVHNAHHAHQHGSQPCHVLGARELDKRLDQLSKLNFDLKMELFHCREKMTKMQEQCSVLKERADLSDKIAEENRTLLDLNDSLVKELEKRDAAVQEAVSIICDLEEKMEHLQHQQVPGACSSLELRPFAKEYFSPDSSSNAIQSPIPESLRKPSNRIPSFVCEKKPSTTALRSVYLEPIPKLKAVQSFASLLSQRESRADDALDVDLADSPRLSVLSESSFPSIYNRNKSGGTQVDASESDHVSTDVVDQGISQPTYDGYRNDESRIIQWVENRVNENKSRQISEDRYRTYQSPVQTMPPRFSTRLQYHSLSNIALTDLAKPALQSPWEVEPARTFVDHRETQLPRATDNVSLHTSRPSVDRPLFGENILPPTPESVSTRLLRKSHSSIADSRSLRERGAKVANQHCPSNRSCTASNSIDVISLQASRSPQARSRQENVGWHQRGRHSMISSSDEDDLAVQDEDTAFNSFRGDGDGFYPSGGSIVTGTPSRFQVRHASPVTNLLFDGDGIEDVPRPAGTRRNTSAEIRLLTGSERPNIDRVDTSPELIRTQARSQGEAFPPQTSPNRQMNHTPEKTRLLNRRVPQKSPSKPTNITAIAAAGMRSSLSQKTQRLFRRMSDSRGDLTASGRTQPFTATSAPVPGDRSPKRPSTARNAESSLPSIPLTAGKSIAASADPERRPSSNGRASMALQAANQALSSRRQSEGTFLSKEPPDTTINKGLFRRAGSVRR